MIKNLPIRIAEIGKIKIGRKGKEMTTRDGNRKYKLPEKVDYFIITTLNRGEDGNFIPDLNLLKKLDPKNSKPRRLKIALPYDKIELNMFTEYSYYAGRKRVCFGDGEKATRIHLDKETKKEKSREIVSCPCECKETGKCKPHGILSLILRDNFQLGGVYQFRTTSYNSIMNIISGLNQIQKMTQGILAMIPLVMSLQPQTVKDKDNIDRRIYAVNITADVQEWKELYEQATNIARIRAESAISIRQLEGKVEEQIRKQRTGEGVVDEAVYTPIDNEDVPEEQEDINAEFSPNTIDEEPEIKDKENDGKDHALDFLDAGKKTDKETVKEPVMVEESDKPLPLW